jgi:hypothetical protein
VKVVKFALVAAGTGVGLVGLAALLGAIAFRDLVNRFANGG